MPALLAEESPELPEALPRSNCILSAGMHKVDVTEIRDIPEKHNVRTIALISIPDAPHRHAFQGDNASRYCKGNELSSYMLAFAIA